MSFPSNEFTFEKEFVGKLPGEPERVPVRVTTRLRVDMDLTSREVQEHKGRAHCVPTYIFGHGGDLPARPTAQALGRHYFKW